MHRLLALVRRRTLGRQIDRELRFHLDQRIEDLVSRGLPPTEAERRARIELGGLQQAREECREVHTIRWLDNVGRDVRLALRMCVRTPTFSFVCILTLALGIGANTALFSIVRGVLLTELPVERPEELVEFACFRVGSDGYDPCHTSYAGFRMYVDQQKSLSGMFGFASLGDLNAVIDGRAELVRGLLLSGAGYGTLGLSPAVGRLPDARDDVPGAPIVAVLSDQFWRRRFGRDPDAIGRTIRINQQTVTIVGATPSSFRGVSLDDAPDMTLPLSSADVFRRPGSLAAGAAWWVGIVGRLSPGVSLERAQAELEPIYQRTLEQTASLLPPEPARGFHQFIKNFRFSLRPANGGTDSYLRGSLDRPLRILSAVVLLVLLITCANLTGLLLSRAIERRREFGIRLALGAGRTSLMRQVLIESMVLALLGGAAGLALAAWLGPALLALGAGDAALRAIALAPDATVLAFTTIVSMICGLMIGAASILRAAGTAPQEAWRPSGGTLKTGWFARVLIAAQVAIAVVLVTAAVLFARSLANIRNVDPGFETESVITLTVAPGLAGYSSPRRLAYLEQAVASLESLPGVASATFTARPLATGVVSQTGVGVPGFRSDRMEDVITGQNRVGPRFIETLGLRLIHGRDLSSADRTSSSSVGIVNESFARHFYGTTDAVGRQFLLPWGDTCSIVGVVRDARDRSIAQPSERWMYLPFVPGDVGQSARIVVRTAVAAPTLLATLPRALATFDPAVPVYDVRTVAVQLERTLGTRRLLAMLGQLFGGVALLLVAVGLYGMLSGLVTRRKREIGVRMALGAQRAGIGWLVVREAVVVIAAGLAVGVLGTLGASRFLRSQLFGIAPNDPWVIAVVTMVLLTAGALAMWLPTRRATRVDPMVTLRYE